MVPAAMVPAPTANDLRKKERGFIELFEGLTLPSWLGLDVDNDAVDLLSGFIWRLAMPVACANNALVRFCGLIGDSLVSLRGDAPEV
jgi:hypothetical protein